MDLNRALQQSNTEQKRFKSELLRKEKAEDKMMINAIVERERMQDKLDKEKLEK